MKRLALLLCVTLGLQSFGSGFFGGGGGSSGVDFTGTVTGVNAIANGGTNSSTALNNNRVIKSASGAIVEAAAITASRALISDANGIPTHSAVTSTQLGYVDFTSSGQTQMDTKAPLASPTFTGTVTLPNAVTVDSTNMTFGNTKKITFGTSTVGNESGNSGRVEVSVPSGGRFTGLENGQQLFTMLADSFNWCAFAAGRDCTFQWGMGKGTSHYGRGRVRGYTAIGPAGNTGAGPDDLLSDTVQANIFVNDGDEWTVTSRGTTGATGNTKTIVQSLCGTSAHTITTTANAKAWTIRCSVTSTGSSAEYYDCQGDVDGTRSHSSGTLAVARSSSCAVKTTGDDSGPSDNGVVANVQQIDFDKAGN